MMLLHDSARIQPETGAWPPKNLTIVLALAAGLLFRLWFVTHAARIAGDTFIYGDIAKNWLDHGIYGFTQASAAQPDALPIPTLIRLPGYPAFLALCFALFGREHYTAVMYVQIFVDLCTCLLVAGLAGRLFGSRAFRAALWLSGLCPFTASYVAAPLAETLTLFCIALSLYSFERWQQSHQAGREANPPFNRWLLLLAATLSYAILLRPEQGLLAAAVLPAMLWFSLSSQGTAPASILRNAAPALLTALLVVLPLAPWTLRNWHTFHVLQPLAPRYANDPGESVPFGFQRWYRTWAIDFTSTEDVYWNYGGDRIDVADIPIRAFDNDAQYTATAYILAEYNRTGRPTPAIDARWNALAEQRIHAKPIRYYLALPVARLLNMALRPRTEMLPTPLEWWKFKDHPTRDRLCHSLCRAEPCLPGIRWNRFLSLEPRHQRWQIVGGTSSPRLGHDCLHRTTSSVTANARQLRASLYPGVLSGLDRRHCQPVPGILGTYL